MRPAPRTHPVRLRVAAGQLRAEADELEARANSTYTTEVVPIPAELAQYGYHDGDFPNWMRERLGLPPMTDEDRFTHFVGQAMADGDC